MKTIFILLMTIFLLSSCAFMKKYKVDGEAVIRSDGKAGIQLKVEPRDILKQVQ